VEKRTNKIQFILLNGLLNRGQSLDFIIAFKNFVRRTLIYTTLATINFFINIWVNQII